MRVEAAEQAGRCSALFLTPHAHDVPLSCARRLSSEAGQGKRVLLAVAFGGLESSTGWPELLGRAGLDWLTLNLPSAAERDPAYAALSQAAFERRDGDAAARSALSERLVELLRFTRPADLYLPMAVGGHIDHRLAHEGGLLAARRLEGVNVFLYEERPAAYLPGAVRLRLAHMGARLPPAARLPRAASLLRTWLRFQLAQFVACTPAGRMERLRASLPLWRAWREARRWRPQRALGVRLQPVVHAAPRAAADGAQGLLEHWLTQPEARGWTAARLRAAGQRYEHGLDPAQPGAERYWLVLPDRGEGLGADTRG